MILLRNGRIGGGAPVDLLIRDGTVARITPSNQLGAESDGRDGEVDLERRHVIPGLWDNHVHLGQLALARHRVDLSRAHSAAEAAATMAGAAAAAPAPAPAPAGTAVAAERQPESGWSIVRGPPFEGVIVGVGFRDGLWSDVPSAAVLDRALDRTLGAARRPPPVVLVSGDLHCCWLNTEALAHFGLFEHPTGILREDAAFEITAALRDVPEDVLDSWISEEADAAARRGVVGVVDLEMADNLTAWSRRIAGGARSLRVAAGIYADHLDAAIVAGRFTGEVIDDTHGLLTVGPFKVLIDGSLNTRTAFCVDEYDRVEGQPATRGVLTVSPDELVALLRRSSGAGLTPAVHAIGDAANRLALDAFEAAGCRGRIEHAQLLRDADLARFAALGVTASVQPEHAMDDREVADHYWAGRTGRAFSLRSLLYAGADIALGSDAPVAPLDPWVTMSAAVWRTRDGREPWHPEQSISVAEAIVASAQGRAAVSTGDIADLCIVDADPSTASPEQLRGMPVSATMLAGRFTHDQLTR